MIEEYFKEYTKAFYDKNRAFKKYIDAKLDFYNITGTKYDDMPKGNRSIGFDDLLAHIEELNEEYIRLYESYKQVRENCLKDIDKMDNPIHKSIIEYTYIDFEKNKKIQCLLKEYFKVDYSYGHLMKMKAQAIKEFNRVIKD